MPLNILQLPNDKLTSICISYQPRMKGCGGGGGYFKPPPPTFLFTHDKMFQGSGCWPSGRHRIIFLCSEKFLIWKNPKFPKDGFLAAKKHKKLQESCEDVAFS